MRAARRSATASKVLGGLVGVPGVCLWADTKETTPVRKHRGRRRLAVGDTGIEPVAPTVSG
jgi:hypothetical protein